MDVWNRQLTDHGRILHQLAIKGSKNKVAIIVFIHLKRMLDYADGSAVMSLSKFLVPRNICKY